MFPCVKQFSNLVELSQQLSELDLCPRNLVLFAEKRVKGWMQLYTSNDINTVVIKRLKPCHSTQFLCLPISGFWVFVILLNASLFVLPKWIIRISSSPFLYPAILLIFSGNPWGSNAEKHFQNASAQML